MNDSEPSVQCTGVVIQPIPAFEQTSFENPDILQASTQPLFQLSDSNASDEFLTQCVPNLSFPTQTDSSSTSLSLDWTGTCGGNFFPNHLAESSPTTIDFVSNHIPPSCDEYTTPGDTTIPGLDSGLLDGSYHHSTPCFIDPGYTEHCIANSPLCSTTSSPSPSSSSDFEESFTQGNAGSHSSYSPNFVLDNYENPIPQPYFGESASFDQIFSSSGSSMFKHYPADEEVSSLR